MGKMSKRLETRLKRKKRIRIRVSGSKDRPRVSVFRSAKNVYAQAIDDDSGVTLVSINSFKDKERVGVGGCTEMGKKFGQEMLAKQITAIVFDKNGYAYHGRVKAFADGMRDAGISF